MIIDKTNGRLAEIKAFAKELNSGKTLAHYSVDILDEAGTKIAYFTGTAFMKGEY